MKKLIYPVAALFIIAASSFAIYQSQGWKIADNYVVKFTSSDPSGVFTGLTGNIQFDEKSLNTSKFEVSIDAASINTGNGMQNTHAKSAQWFDVEKFPLIKFTSTEITKTASGYEAKGILEMHGIQKETVIPFTFQNNTFSGSFDVTREDFNLNPSNGKAAKVIKVDILVPVTKG